ncbi:exosome complex protein Rrp42 [Candidatus Woesearchaeota archaeon]|nr:exosome complex protein Rrp42 [Candidatus Woesearchaeota archaeon]
MKNEKKAHLLRFLERNKRFDGRKLDEFRKIEVQTGISRNAEGSALVKFGETMIMAGVKMSVEKPYPDTPEEGNLMVGAELSPIASPEFESGPPGAEAVELARVIDRGIRESKAIDTKQLCLEKGEKVWNTAIDLVTINASGNLIDAGALAALAAIKDTKLPKYEDKQIDYKKRTDKQLPIKKLPIAVTVYKVGPYMIVDPDAEEEEVAETRLTVTSSEGKISALQKGNEYPLTIEEVEKMITIGLEKAKELQKHIR